MAPNDIREKLNRVPYQPIRIYVSDGAWYDVRYGGEAMLSLMELCIGIMPDEQGIPTKTIYVDPRHVTRIEPLPAEPDGSNGVRE